MRLLSQEYLKELLRYDSKTGSFFWKVNKGGRIKVGSMAGYYKHNHTTNKGYWHIKINSVKYPAHRLVWLYFLGVMPCQEMDHINGNSSDNRFENLREVSRGENAKNLKLSAANKSGVCGVLYLQHRNRWRSFIVVEGRQVSKILDDFFEACCFRKSAERKYGFHENHGISRAAA